MNNIKPDILFLEYNEFKNLSSEGPLRIILRCLEGSGWITREGDPKDYFVNEGNILEFCDGKTGLLLQSLSDKLIIEVTKLPHEEHSELCEAM